MFPWGPFEAASGFSERPSSPSSHVPRSPRGKELPGGQSGVPSGARPVLQGGSGYSEAGSASLSCRREASAGSELARRPQQLGGKTARAYSRPLRLIYDLSGLFAAESRDFEKNEPARSQSRLTFSPSVETLKKTSPRGRKVSPLSLRASGLWKKRAREVAKSAHFLSVSRDFGKNEPARSQSQPTFSPSLGTLKKTSPRGRKVSPLSLRVPGL